MRRNFLRQAQVLEVQVVPGFQEFRVVQEILHRLDDQRLRADQARPNL